LAFSETCLTTETPFSPPCLRSTEGGAFPRCPRLRWGLSTPCPVSTLLEPAHTMVYGALLVTAVASFARGHHTTLHTGRLRTAEPGGLPRRPRAAWSARPHRTPSPTAVGSTRDV